MTRLVPRGLVSNCWRRQLDLGTSLDELLAESVRQGYTFVELRQGALGHYEDPVSKTPLAELLSCLPARFASLELSLALACPFFDVAAGDGVPWNESFAAAEAVSGGRAACLRLVDLATSHEVAARTCQTAGESLAARLRPFVNSGGRVLLENAAQAFSSLAMVMRAARAALGRLGEHLGLCYDPCNVLLSPDRSDPLAVTRSVGANSLGMFHIKQAIAGVVQPDIVPGDIQWREHLSAVERLGFEGPVLYELAASENVWERLAASRKYLAGLWMDS